MSKPYNDFCTVQRPSTEVDGLGESEGWVNVLEQLSCSVDPLSGRNLIAAQQRHAEVSHVVEMRYRPGITIGMRVLFKGRPFEILWSRNQRERGETLELYCAEGVSNG